MHQLNSSGGDISGTSTIVVAAVVSSDSGGGSSGTRSSSSSSSSSNSGTNGGGSSAAAALAAATAATVQSVVGGPCSLQGRMGSALWFSVGAGAQDMPSPTSALHACLPPSPPLSWEPHDFLSVSCLGGTCVPTTWPSTWGPGVHTSGLERSHPERGARGPPSPSAWSSSQSNQL